jgi:hypothetical protein
MATQTEAICPDPTELYHKLENLDFEQSLEFYKSTPSDDLANKFSRVLALCRMSKCAKTSREWRIVLELSPRWSKLEQIARENYSSCTD